MKGEEEKAQPGEEAGHVVRGARKGAITLPELRNEGELRKWTWWSRQLFPGTGLSRGGRS